MSGRNYYLITALPALGDLGSLPAMSCRQLLDHVADNPRPTAILAALFLSDDLLQRQGFCAGEIGEPEPCVLSIAQARDEQPLPDYLAVSEDEPSARSAEDALWSAYFRHAHQVGKAKRSNLLTAWVGYEVALRNALAVARAQALNLEPADYLVATELADDEQDFSQLINEWTASDNPLSALQVLDRARWLWLTEHDRWFSFADDELAAYAARLLLLQR